MACVRNIYIKIHYFFRFHNWINTHFFSSLTFGRYYFRFGSRNVKNDELTLLFKVEAFHSISTARQFFGPFFTDGKINHFSILEAHSIESSAFSNLIFLINYCNLQCRERKHSTKLFLQFLINLAPTTELFSNCLVSQHLFGAFFSSKNSH